MLLSFALVFLFGFVFGKLFEKLHLPSFFGMLLSGMLLGPFGLNLLDVSIVNISADLTQFALILILTRAGLNIDIDDLKKIGRPAFLLCFVPASFEIIGTILLAPKLLSIPILDAAILGTVLAAVSPAVVVPRMLNLIERGYGRRKRIPQMVMAGASVDDVFVIVLFSAFTKLAQTGTIHASQFLTIPTSIAFGSITGFLIGRLLLHLFSTFHMRDSYKVIIILSVSFILVSIEQYLHGIVGFSGLLAVMALGISIQQKRPDLSKRLSSKFSKLWVGGELLLFVLVGAKVNIRYAFQAGGISVLLIIGVMCFRMVGVFFSVAKSTLNRKERVFTAFSYIPKATVQAAIGGLPLAMGLSNGDLILTIAVLAIMITAPFGAILIDQTHSYLLTRDE